MSAFLSPSPWLQFVDDNGVPLAGGTITTYAAGTSTPQATYTDYSGTIACPNPIVLDAAGRAFFWLATEGYKYVISSADGTFNKTIDNINAGGSPGSPTLEFVTITQLRAFSVTGAAFSPLAVVAGCLAAQDGGGGIYWWNPSSSATDDGSGIYAGLVVTPNTPPTSGLGRWLRIMNQGEIPSISWYGASGSTPINTALLAADAAAYSLGISTANPPNAIRIPNGIQWPLTSCAGPNYLKCALKFDVGAQISWDGTNSGYSLSFMMISDPNDNTDHWPTNKPHVVDFLNPSYNHNLYTAPAWPSDSPSIPSPTQYQRPIGDNSVAQLIATETARAEAAESGLTAAIPAAVLVETTRAENAEQILNNLVITPNGGPGHIRATYLYFSPTFTDDFNFKYIPLTNIDPILTAANCLIISFSVLWNNNPAWAVSYSGWEFFVAANGTNIAIQRQANTGFTYTVQLLIARLSST